MRKTGEYSLKESVTVKLAVYFFWHGGLFLAAWRLGGLAAWRLGGLAAWRLGGLAAWRLGGLAVALLALAPMGGLSVGFGNVRAGVVGISPIGSVQASASTTGFTFTTKASGSRITGIGLYSRLTNAAATGMIVSFAASGLTTQTGTFGVIASTAGLENNIVWDTGFTGDLITNKTYSVIVSNYGFSSGSVASTNTIAKFRSINDTALNAYTVSTDLSSYWTAVKPDVLTDMRFRLYAVVVPEPATIILTSSALVAGAIGVFIKRRRRLQTADTEKGSG
ncbi:MAG: PEP-CTERM sorting domain-containing protein [Planctomycetota bacterium]|nr:PEP-CTERM sorting domain-containing protein [Planctomycetota bacterium]